MNPNNVFSVFKEYENLKQAYIDIFSGFLGAIDQLKIQRKDYKFSKFRIDGTKIEFQIFDFMVACEFSVCWVGEQLLGKMAFKQILDNNEDPKQIYQLLLDKQTNIFPTKDLVAVTYLKSEYAYYDYILENLAKSIIELFEKES